MCSTSDTDNTAAIIDPIPHIPSYVSVRIDPPMPTLIAGRRDSIRLEVRIDTTKIVEGRRLDWDRESATPVIAWMSVTRESGITFMDRNSPNSSEHQIMVRFKPQRGDDSGTLTQYIQYSVDSRIATGKYFFVLDILAELETESGHKVQDAGVINIPYELDTHLSTKLLMLVVVAVTIFLFVIEWVRVDVVAIIMMILLPELGLLKASETFRGLSSNAVIAIIGVMIISFGLNRTGLVDRIILPLMRFVGRGETRLVVIFSSLIAAISSVMQNTGAAVLFLPAIRSVTSKKLNIPISRVLMPIGMAAILGGTLTMIGTSPLILLNDILPQGMPKFGFLELTPVGLALAAGGILYLSTIGMKLLSKLPVNQKDSSATMDNMMQDEGVCCYPEITGPYEIFVPPDYRPSDGPQDIASIRRQFQVNIVAMGAERGFLDIAPAPKTTLREGVGLCVYGPKEAVTRFVKDYRLVLREKPIIFWKKLFNPSYAGIVEMVISPRSMFIGKTIKEIGFRETYEVNALALHQNGKVYYKELADRSLNSGDGVLIHGTWEQIQRLKEQHQNFIITSPTRIEIHKPEKAGCAFVSFMVALILMVISSSFFLGRPYNPIPLSICLMIGAMGMILTKVMTISEAYRAIDTRTVFLLGGLIPLGMAVDQTGTAQWLAKGIVFGLGDFMSPLVLLIVLAVLSCAFTMVISNVGACTLLIPLGVSLASQIGIDPRVAVVVVGIGVSNSFILPTHQVNALYMGPGEYRTKDYIKIGGGLSLVYITILVTTAYLFYL